MEGSAEYETLDCQASFCQLDLNLITVNTLLSNVKYLVNVLNFTTIDLSQIIKIAHLISAYKMKAPVFDACTLLFVIQFKHHFKL